MTEAETKSLKMYAEWFSSRGDHTIRAAMDEIERLRTALKFIAADPPDGKYAQEIAKEALAVAVPEDAL